MTGGAAGPSAVAAPRPVWVALFYAAYFAVLGVALPYLGPYLDGRGAVPVTIGIATAMLPLAKTVYAPWAAAAADRGRWRRGFLTAHAGVSTAAALALPAAPSPLVEGVLLFVVGSGYGAVLPVVEATVLERLPPASYGRLRLWGSVGFVVAAPLAGWAVGPEASAFPLVLAAALAVTAVACMPFEGAVGPEVVGPGSGRLPPPVWALLALLTAHQMGHGPYYGFFSLRLEAAGWPAPTIGVAWSAGVVAELGAFLAAPALQRRWGVRRIMTVALAATPVRWALLAAPVSVATVTVAQIGHAASFALAHLAGVQLVQRLAPAGGARRAQAWYSGLTYGLGMVIGTSLAGPLWRVSGSLAFAVAAVVAVVVAVVWLPLSRRLGPPRRDRPDRDQKITCST